MVFKNLYTFIAAHYLNIPGTDTVSEYINRTDMEMLNTVVLFPLYLFIYLFVYRGISMWSLNVIPLCATFLLK